MKTCPKCKGNGNMFVQPCSKCKGSRTVLGVQNITINIPANSEYPYIVYIKNAGNEDEYE